SAVLIGNDPFPGTGTWSFISGPSVPTLVAMNANEASVQNLIGSSTPYLFEYSVQIGTCISRDTMALYNSLAPSTSYAGSNQDVCLDESGVITLAAAMPESGEGTWSMLFGPANVNIENPSNPGTRVSGLTAGFYLFDWTVSSGSCEASSSSIFVTVTSAPEVFAGNDTTIQSAPFKFHLNDARIHHSEAFYWSTSGTGSFDDPTAINPIYTASHDDIHAGMAILSLNATGAYPCGDASDEIKLYFGVQQPNVNAGNDIISCADNSVVSLNKAAASNYSSSLWESDGDGHFGNPENIETTYTPGISDLKYGNVNLRLTVHAASGPIAVDSLNLILIPSPLAEAGNDLETCAGSAIEINGSSASAYASIQWTHDGLGELLNPQSIHPEYIPAINETGLIHLQLSVTGSEGCAVTATDAVKLMIHGLPQINPVVSWEQISGKTAISMQVSLPDPDASIASTQLSFGDGSSSLLIPNEYEAQHNFPMAGNYPLSLIITDKNGCTIAFDTLIHVQKANNLEIGEYDSIICTDSPFALELKGKSGNSVICDWGDGSAATVLTADQFRFSHVYTQSGNYIVNLYEQISGLKQLPDSLSLRITVAARPVSVFSIEDNYRFEQGHIRLVNGSIGGNSYQWDFSNGSGSTEESPEVNFDEEGEYNITLISTNKFGCSDTSSTVYRSLFKSLFIPNAFAPGIKSGNWKPSGLNLADYKASIFSRNGQLIWSSEQLDEHGSPIESWDGTLNGIPCSEGIYVWKIKATFKDGSEWGNRDIGNRTNMPDMTTGTITLIR
ncbi:MAG: hypothetical protein IPH88_17555, partial [Bacteroidales bacterium]|nr:hypothetical protein [Bacteroidales bacterium]